MGMANMGMANMGITNLGNLLYLQSWRDSIFSAEQKQMGIFDMGIALMGILDMGMANLEIANIKKRMRHTRNDAGHDSQKPGAIHENTAVIQQ